MFMRKQVDQIEEIVGYAPPSGPQLPTCDTKITLYDRITVSSRFRRIVAKALPGLGDNLAYWRLMNYLLFGAWEDQETGQRLLAHELLAEIAGHKSSNSNFRSWKFLEQFRAEVFAADAFQWTRHKPKKKCRQVSKLVLPPEVAQALEDEFARKHYETGRVYFTTGIRFTRERQTAERNRQQKEALSNAPNANSKEAREILAYLNNLPPHLFHKMQRENHEDAVKVARLTPNRKGRRRQLEILKHIYEQPQPFYQPSKTGNTDRVFGVIGSLPLLSKPVRTAWTKGWYKADLRSAQLAINAKLWNVPEVTEFLKRNERSIWKELTNHFLLTGNDAERAKGALKKALYSLCYGMDARKIATHLKKELKKVGIQRNGRFLLKHPLIRALMAARKRMTRRISKAGGGASCFGRWHSTTDILPHQILALQSQAIELKLMHPLFVMAAKSKDLTITLFLHDGMAIHFTDKNRLASWKRRMSNEVGNIAATYGIETDLEWEQ
jgi:hypothetical protein